MLTTAIITNKNTASINIKPKARKQMAPSEWPIY